MKTSLIATGAFCLAALFGSSAYAADEAYCDDQAHTIADQQANPGQAAVAPGLIGALTGLGISSARGNPHPGLAALGGGALGAALGVAANRPRWQAAYDQAFAECMNSEPVRVVAVPPVGSGAWYRNCARKYRSFDQNSGLFTKYDGTQQACQLP